MSGTGIDWEEYRERVPSDMWKKYGCAPIERRPGLLVIAVDDPQAPGELTTLVTGTATFEEMADFVTYLQPVTP